MATKTDPPTANKIGPLMITKSGGLLAHQSMALTCEYKDV